MKAGGEKTARQARSARRDMVAMSGLAVSRGVASGPAFLLGGDGEAAPVPEYRPPPDGVPAELARCREAAGHVRTQLAELVDRLRANGEDSVSEIFANHLAMLEDKVLMDDVERRIVEGPLNAEAAVRRAVGGFREMFGRMKDAYLRERMRDLDDLERRLLEALSQGGGKTSTSAFARLTAPAVVVASDLTPSETVSLPRELVLGIATDHGSATSHVALLARALGIPSVVGLGEFSSAVRPGDMVLLDGVEGTATANPDRGARLRFARLAARERKLQETLGKDRVSRPRLPVKLCANVQPGVPMDDLAEKGAEGVGLYRSEYLWMESSDEPDEERQTRIYAEAVRMVSALGPAARTVFRTFDLGGDKMRRGRTSNEANPFLGCRSIRYSLEHRDVFRAQLRAILRASAEGPAAVMYPMVAAVEELREANEELERAKAELRAEGVAFDERIRHGVMVEVPSAALNAEAFAAECDFFSIGTNDLVQYTMAADRGNSKVSHLYQPANPAVVKLVEMAISAAKAAGIHVAVCGESASDPVLGAVWTALGADELSMSAGYIPTIRKVIDALGDEDLRRLAQIARGDDASRTSEEVYCDCRRFLVAKIPMLAEMKPSFVDARRDNRQ